ncbi:DNA-binding IclR family transcriptional regulator [Allocatelliglobosispora scoriae]|uniref:DNA-binding IclR family transcriptional regulator n=1 Tax=Allocatelliglobosispora scoriae TaxID=643052 RepID=A0A841BSN0_9ACTN|nr:helix-turn-helix domain-containing protein [Allocatelliglobosispora scoriae]MBB5870715.1 DNA-binding IclR family transcriptional regulator [Allocatelliglobosispora scoriae]
MDTAQTLDRGLRLLTLVAETPGGLTVTEASQRLGVGRAVIYRLTATLVEHAMLRRADNGRLLVGVGLVHLARRAQPLLADAALPALRRLAEQVGATAHLTVADGAEAVAVAVVEPTSTVFHVAYRSGSRHQLERGAAGRAILTGELCTSLGELQDGAFGIAAPVLGVAGMAASVGVVSLTPLDVNQVGKLVTAAATAIGTALA